MTSRDARDLQSRDVPLSRFRCNACGYGASRRVAPERCPMCGGTVWDFEAWRPFSGLVSDLEARSARARFDER